MKVKKFSIDVYNWDDVICFRMCKRGHRDRLIIAGALIAAELDRILALERKE